MFERVVGVDWSGAAEVTTPVDIAVATSTVAGPPRVVRPAHRTRWSRCACVDWLVAQLSEESPRTLFLIDAGLAYPAGAARVLFGATSFRHMVAEIGRLLGEHKRARALAEHINARFPDGAPFRFDDTRADGRFHERHAIAYYRQTELFVPQVISELYMGSGGKVAFHTLTFLGALSELMERRDRGELAFSVWPFEPSPTRGGGHVFVECYPALCRSRVKLRHEGNEHERDALAACEWARQLLAANALAPLLELVEVPVGRDTRLSWRDQITEEGWIFGVRVRP